LSPCSDLTTDHSTLSCQLLELSQFRLKLRLRKLHRHNEQIVVLDFSGIFREVKLRKCVDIYIVWGNKRIYIVISSKAAIFKTRAAG
jgi:hypothetical protein